MASDQHDIRKFGLSTQIPPSERSLQAFCRTRKLYSTIFVLLVMAVFLELITYFSLSNKSFNGIENMDVFKLLNIRPFRERSRCPGNASGMMRGHWRTRPLSVDEETAVESFLTQVRVEHDWNKSVQRRDGKCGNAYFKKGYPAMCELRGPTPCCFEYKCVNKTVDQCKCPTCYDLRSRIKAEFATWVPEDPRCEIKDFTANDLCYLLRGTRIVVVGDSLMRHLYLGLALVLADMDYDQVFLPRVPQERRANCTGMNMFGLKDCRFIYRYEKATFCNGSTNISYLKTFFVRSGGQFHAAVKTYLDETEAASKTIFVVSIGMHGTYNTSVYDDYMLPAIKIRERHQNRKAVQFIWATNHMFALLKRLLKGQDNESVDKFNKFMIEKLRPHEIPVLDFYNLTAGVFSPDGVHFSIGVNINKAKMLLNFLKHLVDNRTL